MTAGRPGEELSVTSTLEDHLTGLPNRRALVSHLRTLTSEDAPFGLLCVALDGLGRLNAAEGEQQGDRALMEVARLLSAGLRTEDSVFRHGGGRFVVASPGLRPGTEAGPGRRVLEMIDSTLPAGWGIAAGVGLALFPADATGAADLLALAEMAAESAKGSGGGRVLRWREGHDLFWRPEVFAGRKDMLAELYNRLYPGRDCSLVLLSGGPGTGKTELLNNAVARLPSDVEVLRLDCTPEMSGIPYAGLAEALRSQCRRLGVPRVGSAQESALSALLPGLFNKPASGASDPVEPWALMESLTALLRRWTPAVLVVDCGRWLDEATVDLIRWMLTFHRISDLSVCCVMSPEVEGPPPPVEQLLEHPLAAEMALEPMSPEELRSLAAARLGAAAVSQRLLERLVELSAGNPLLATEQLRSLLSAGCLKPSGERRLTITSVPSSETVSSIRELVDAGLGMLDEDDRLVLARAAALGRCFDAADVAGLASLREGQVLGCMDRAVALGLLRQCPDPMRFRLTVAELRRALLDGLPANLRMECHRSAARLLAGRERHGMAAVHYEETGSDGQAAEERIAAAGELLGGGLAHLAAGQLEKAVALLEDGSANAAPKRIAELSRKAARTLFQSGDLPEARQLALRAAETFDAQGLAREAEQSRLLAAEALLALSRPKQALCEIDGLDSEWDWTRLRRFEAIAALGQLREARNGYLALAGVEDLDLAVRALHGAAMTELAELRFSRADGHCRRALRRAARLGEHPPWWLLHDRAEICLYCGKITESRRSASQAAFTAGRRLSHWGGIWALLALCRARTRALRPKLALQAAARAAELAERAGSTEAQAACQLVEAETLIALGRMTTAAGRLHQAACSGVADPRVTAYFKARLDLLAGNVESAEELVTGALEPGKDGCGPTVLLAPSMICEHDLHLLLWQTRLVKSPAKALESLQEMDLSDYPRGRLWRARLESRALRTMGDGAEARSILEDALADRKSRRETLERMAVYADAQGLLPQAGRRLARLRARLSSR